VESSGPDGISNVIELAVGVACLLGGGGMSRKPGLRWVGVLVIAAGLAAAAHAIWALA
jgi:hypothetical protein